MILSPLCHSWTAGWVNIVCISETLNTAIYSHFFDVTIFITNRKFLLVVKKNTLPLERNSVSHWI